jgi:hypothetical protein
MMYELNRDKNGERSDKMPAYYLLNHFDRKCVSSRRIFLLYQRIIDTNGVSGN